MRPVICCCGDIARLTSGKKIYPHRRDLRDKLYYECGSCGGRVGCHPGTTKALGRPADSETRKERLLTHLVVDPIWKNARERRARRRVYDFIAAAMQLNGHQTHIGMFDAEQCRKVRHLLSNVTYADIKKSA